MQHRIVSHGEWLQERTAFLAKEKELTRLRDRLAEERRALPWVEVEKSYVFDTPAGKKSLSELFDGRSQLIVKFFMLAPGQKEGCVGCSFEADHVEGTLVHLENHDVSYVAVARAPLDEIDAFKTRMGWSFPWVSSFGSDFNYDFNVSVTEEQQRAGNVEYNYREFDARPILEEPSPGVEQFAAMTGTDPATYVREQPGMSAFALEDGAVYQTYTTTWRGLEFIMGYYPILDRAPKGRDEGDDDWQTWLRRHDEYGQS